MEVANSTAAEGVGGHVHSRVVGIITTIIILLSLGIGHVRTRLVMRTHPSFKPVLDALFEELSVIGVISMCVFFMLRIPGIKGISEHYFGDELTLGHDIELVHAGLFVVMLLFMSQVLGLIFLVQRRAKVWKRFEREIQADVKTRSSYKRSPGGTSRKGNTLEGAGMTAVHKWLVLVERDVALEAKKRLGSAKVADAELEAAVELSPEGLYASLQRRWLERRVKSCMQYFVLRHRFVHVREDWDEDLPEMTERFDFAEYLSVVSAVMSAGMVHFHPITWVAVEALLLLSLLLENLASMEALVYTAILFGWSLLVWLMVIDLKLRRILRAMILPYRTVLRSVKPAKPPVTDQDASVQGDLDLRAQDATSKGGSGVVQVDTSEVAQSAHAMLERERAFESDTNARKQAFQVEKFSKLRRAIKILDDSWPPYYFQKANKGYSKHEGLFWFKAQGPHMLQHLLASTFLLSAVYFAFSCFAMGPMLIAGKLPTALIPLIFTPVVLTFVCPVYLIENMVYACNLEKLKDRNAITKVLRSQKMRKMVAAMTLLSSIKAQARVLTNSLAEKLGDVEEGLDEGGDEEDGSGRDNSSGQSSSDCDDGDDNSGVLSGAKSLSALDTKFSVARRPSLLRRSMTGSASALSPRTSRSSLDPSMMSPRRMSKQLSARLSLSGRQSSRMSLVSRGSKLISRGSSSVGPDLKKGLSRRSSSWMSRKRRRSSVRAQQERELKEVFDLFDTDGDGHVDVKEMKALFLSLGNDLSEEKVREIVHELDVDGNGTIEFDEFRDGIMRRQVRHLSTREVVQTVFAMIDTDGDGSITMTEFRRHMRSNRALNAGLSDEDLDTLVREMDVNGDGSVDMEEFAQMLKLYGVED